MSELRWLQYRGCTVSGYQMNFGPTPNTLWPVLTDISFTWYTWSLRSVDVPMQQQIFADARVQLLIPETKYGRMRPGAGKAKFWGTNPDKMKLWGQWGSAGNLSFT